MLIVAWREITSGDRGVSVDTSSVLKSCRDRGDPSVRALRATPQRDRLGTHRAAAQPPDPPPHLPAPSGPSLWSPSWRIYPRAALLTPRPLPAAATPSVNLDGPLAAKHDQNAGPQRLGEINIRVQGKLCAACAIRRWVLHGAAERRVDVGEPEGARPRRSPRSGSRPGLGQGHGSDELGFPLQPCTDCISYHI